MDSMEPKERTSLKDDAAYRRAFGIPKHPELNKRAWDAALDIRKFEIDLYWKRGTYFWTLIAAVFAGFFAVQASTIQAHHREFYAYVLAWIGLIFSVAWVRVNQGSKFWQENWESHVDALEDNVIGPLYKTVLWDKERRGKSVSVTAVNLATSRFTAAAWVLLGGFVLLCSWPAVAALWIAFLAVTALGGVLLFLLLRRTSTRRNPRRTYLIDDRFVAAMGRKFPAEESASQNAKGPEA